MSQDRIENQKTIYDTVRSNGLLARIADLVRNEECRLKNQRYGPKYELNKNGIVVHVDDYGNFMTVRLNGELMCSTHPTERLFIPHAWVNELLPLGREAMLAYLSDKTKDNFDQWLNREQ